MAKLFTCLVLCLLVIATTACQPRPGSTTPRPPPTLSLEAKIKEKLDEWDKASEAIAKKLKTNEDVKKAMEIGEGVTEIAEAFMEDMPFVKVLGALFSIFGAIFDQTAKILEDILDEMEKQFAEINRRLDKIEWEIIDMMRTLKTTIEDEDLQREFDQIKVIQDAKIRYQEKPDVTTLQALRDICKGTSNPTTTMDVLHNKITTKSSAAGTFTDAIFESVQYGRIAWATWTKEISQHFLQAMLMQQVCLGVKINKDRSRPTEQDMEFYANYSRGQFEDVMNVMKSKSAEIDRDWHEKQLPTDIDQIMRDKIHENAQTVANEIHDFLKKKYGFYFGVIVYENGFDVTKNVYQEQMVKIRQDGNKRTAIVNWSSQSKLDQSTRTSTGLNAIDCVESSTNPESSANVNAYINKARSQFSTATNRVFDYLLIRKCDKSNDQGRGPPDCSISNDKLASKFDKENTAVIHNYGCRTVEFSDPVICYDGRCHSNPFKMTHDYGVFAAVGF